LALYRFITYSGHCQPERIVVRPLFWAYFQFAISLPKKMAFFLDAFLPVPQYILQACCLKELL
jgi:hypothetical protein